MFEVYITVLTIIFILLVWHMFGGILLAFTTIENESCYEAFHPKGIYKHHKVNRFGCCMLCILHNLCCPLLSIIFWIYYLCAVGIVDFEEEE